MSKMVSTSSLKEHKSMDLSKKLRVLKTIIKSESKNTNSILEDAMLNIRDLKLQIEAITKECEGMTFIDKEVKVEKNGNKFMVRVNCKKGEKLLESIIEAFEKLESIMVLHVKTTYEEFFFMEEVVEDEHQILEVKNVTNAVLIAIDM